MWTEQLDITWNNTVVGIRTDDGTGLPTLLAHLDVEGRPPGPDWQNDLSVEFGASQRSERPILALRHGERVVVRTRSIDRLLAAAVNWLNGLTTVPEGPAIELHTLAARSGGDATNLTLFPRFVAADTGVLERLAPADTRWIDAPWFEFVDGVATAPGGLAVGTVGAVVLDRGAGEIEVSRPAVRALAAVSRLRKGTAEQRLDAAVALATGAPTWATVNTEDQQLASRLVADVVTGQ